MTQKVFIVEDEPCVRDEIKYMLGRYDQLAVAGEADNAFDAICAIQSLRPDIVFLDIQLGDIDGIALAKKITELDLSIKLVFITAFENYALEGFELNAVDYVLKPFSEQRLDKTVERLLQDQHAPAPPPLPANSGANRIMVRQNNNWRLLDIEDILYFQSQDHLTLAYTLKDAYSLNSTLRELEQQLPPSDFLRTHKSFIVNLRQINEIIPWFNYTYKITLRQKGVEIPVSRSYIKKFKATVTFF